VASTVTGDMKSRSDFVADLLLVPNLISVGRVVGVMAAATLFYLGYLRVCLAIGLVTGFTDYLDGYLARRLNQTSKLGALLDIVADLLAAFICLTVAVYARLWPVYLLLLWGIRDISVLAMRASAAQQGFEIPASLLGKIATNFTGYAYMLMALDLVRPFPGHVELSRDVHLAGLWAIHIGIGLQWVAGIIYLRLYARRYRRA
jgi:cardiolipin synthase (CMP-forming)